MWEFPNMLSGSLSSAGSHRATIPKLQPCFRIASACLGIDLSHVGWVKNASKSQIRRAFRFPSEQSNVGVAAMDTVWLYGRTPTERLPPQCSPCVRWSPVALYTTYFPTGAPWIGPTYSRPYDGTSWRGFLIDHCSSRFDDDPRR